MYAIHTTPGFIIDSRPRGEAGKLLYVFTRDLGLVLATAEGIRLEKSKLRYHVRDYSFGTFSFVRGKEFWRLTSAAREEGGSEKLTSTTPSELIVRIAGLLKKFLHGEEPHPELFDVIHSCGVFVEKHSVLDREQAKSFESLIVLRMLYHLGYVGKDVQMDEFFRGPEITPELLEKALPLRLVMNQHINKALKESHL
jgi:recombinational DNA repair protein (RecF pathway)